MARKPLIGTVAANVQQFGTGGLSIDGCRVETSENLNGGAYSEDRKPSDSEWVAHGGTIHSFAGKEFEQPVGRWPANLILTYPEDEYELRDDVTPEQLRQIAGWMDAH